MRTVNVGDDYVANFSKTSKTSFSYRVVHRATNRKILVGACGVTAGQDAEQVVTAAALADLAALDRTRRDASRRFAQGEAVEGAPVHLPPVQREQIARAGEFTISAELPVRLIREAFDRLPFYATGLTIETKTIAREQQALAVGHQVLVGVTDEQILKIARRQATLVGSSLTGVALKETP